VIFVSIGLPGRCAQWCDAVIARIVGQSRGPIAVKTWPTVGDMLGHSPVRSALEAAALTLIESDAGDLLLAVRQPDEGLRLALAEAEARPVVALDDPRLAVAELAEATGAPLGAATRAIANGCALVMPCLAMSGALVIRAEDAAADPRATVQAIARHLASPLADARIDAIVAELAQAGPRAGAPERDAWPLRIPLADHRLVEGALAGYAEVFARRTLGAIIWGRELFLLAGTPDRSPTDLLELAGGERFLVHGPYIHLPPGRWSARIVLGFSPDAAGSSLVVDAFADARQLGQTTLAPTKGGVYAADIDFSLDAPSERGLEIRVLIAGENARGQLAFGHVVLQPVAMRQADVFRGSDDFKTVLAL
jgi:hypothetical protein